VEKDFHLEIRSRRRENKGSHRWVSVRGSHRRVSCHTKISIQFFVHVHVQGFSGDSHIHTHLKKCAVLVRTTGQTFPGLSAVVFLSVGHYPYYGSPDFSIIKSFSALFSLQGFSRGIYPKILVFMCA
jgi:hypothetical protein